MPEAYGELGRTVWWYNDGSASLPTEIISFIEDAAPIKKILKHCGKWKEAIPRPPSQIIVEPASVAEEVTLDYSFFEQNCI